MKQEDLKQLLGQSEQNAREFAQKNKCILFVGTKDGKSFYKTMDYNPYRINIVVYNDIVREATIG